MTNVTRTLGKHKKRDVSVMAIRCLGSEMAAAGTYEVGNLPKRILVIASTSFVVVPFDGTLPTADFGITGDSTAFDALVALDGTADTVVAGAGNIHMPTGAEVTVTRLVASTLGEVWLIIEYIEYDQCTGELTNFSTS